MRPTVPIRRPILRLGSTRSIKDFRTSGASSPSKLLIEMQTRLAACQRRNGRTCRDSQRISEGIHELIPFPGLRNNEFCFRRRATEKYEDRAAFHPSLGLFAIPTIENDFPRHGSEWTRLHPDFMFGNGTDRVKAFSQS